jgi:hypothetical protein
VDDLEMQWWVWPLLLPLAWFAAGVLIAEVACHLTRGHHNPERPDGGPTVLELLIDCWPGSAVPARGV